jgi:enoyl-CoA hydratase
MSNEVLMERRGRVLVITLNRPEVKNAINTEMARGLLEAVRVLDEASDLTVGVLTGSRNVFSSGMDLRAFAESGVPRGLTSFTENGSTKPLIAAIESYALAGALEVALGCDLIVASKGTKLGAPEVTRGIFAGAGGIFRLPNRLPYSVAVRMLLTGDPITAEDAFKFGMVTELAEPGETLEMATTLALKISENAPLALKATKQLLSDSQGMSEREYWEHQKPLVRQVFRSEDAREGAVAFAQRRLPVWTSR